MTLRDLLIKLEAIPVEGMLISYRVESGSSLREPPVVNLL